MVRLCCAEWPLPLSMLLQSGEITIDEFENKAPDWPIMAVRWSLYDCVASGKLAGQGRPEAGFTSVHVFAQLPINVFDL